MNRKLTILAAAAAGLAGIAEKANAAVTDHMTRQGLLLCAASPGAKQTAEAQQKAADEALEREAQREMDRRLREIEESDAPEEEKARQREQARGTKGTPAGMGRSYETRPSGSAQVHGKASAHPAGGNPVTSPVIGNPGEARPDAGHYDYAIAAQAGNPNALSETLRSADFPGAPSGAARQTKIEHPRRVVAIRKGEYAGIKEAGEEFDNDRNLPCYPEDEKSWFKAADEADQKAVVKRAEQRTKQQADADANLRKEVEAEVIRRKGQEGKLR